RPNLGASRAAYGSTVLSSAESLDVSQSSLLNGAAELKLSRSNEKEQLQGLNDRFAGYIEKGHYLEQQNKEIEAALAAPRQRASHATVERKDYLKTDLTTALKEIRAQLECQSDHNMHQAEEWFKCRYAKLTEAAEQNKEAIRSAKEEIAEYRRQLQSKSIELESVRGTKESLERQLSDIEE
ncbi:PREDICTED: neurofilament medium polypeptide-like, partial [Cariama cristata]|uniref:neurofilament medium polypeptide-like n=1 Tax=Cariama cristata TaxID=54380 RepID=UPI0005201FE9